jgi:hypothetical protein
VRGSWWLDSWESWKLSDRVVGYEKVMIGVGLMWLICGGRHTRCTSLGLWVLSKCYEGEGLLVRQLGCLT